jgi:6-phosphofructokinase 1
MTPRGNLVVGQSGGPTVVINQSLYGVAKEAFNHEAIDGVFGALNGVEGILGRRFVDLRRESSKTLEEMAQTPSAALGSCRFKPKENDCKAIFEIFRSMNVHYFFYIGGNDSALSAGIINKIAREQNYELRIFHVPKTIDNDLLVTDHCPGYGSAAKYVAQCFMGNDADNRSLPGIKIDVCMGRNAGWLTAASALGRRAPDDGPHLIYLPERPTTVKKLCEDIHGVYLRLGRCLVAVSEGLTHSGDHKTFLQSKAILEELKQIDMENLARELEVGGEVDAFGHSQLSGTGALADFLAAVVKEYLVIHHKDEKTGKPKKFRVRADTLGYAQRSMAGVVSPVDAQEAFEAGVAAVRYAMRGDIDGSVCFRRLPSDIEKYFGDIFLAKLEDVSGVNLPKGQRQYRTMDDVDGSGNSYKFIADSGNDVTPDFISWLAPLAGPLPVKTLLEKQPVKAG